MLSANFCNLSIKTTPDLLEQGELVGFGRLINHHKCITGGKVGGFYFLLLLKPKEHAFILNNPVNVLENGCVCLVGSL